MRTDALKKSLQRPYFIDALKACGQNAKKKWQLVKQFWPSSKKNGNISKKGTHTDDEGKAKTMNEYFFSDWG